jgi:thioesterase domain-containing protein
MEQRRSSAELETAIAGLWRAQIPLSGHLALRLARLDEHVLELEAPLAPNRNHMGTGFAGSLLAVASLAGWGAVVAMLESVDVAHVVAQEMNASFIEPVTDDFRVAAQLPAAPEREQFLRAFHRYRRARVAIVAEVLQGGRVAARIDSRFVALKT